MWQASNSRMRTGVNEQRRLKVMRWVDGCVNAFGCMKSESVLTYQLNLLEKIVFIFDIFIIVYVA